MLFVTQLRRRQRSVSLLGSLIFVVFLFICLRLLSREDVEKPTSDEDRVMSLVTSPKSRKATSALVSNRFHHFIARKRDSKHRYQSESVEALIGQVYATVGDKELAWLFENCFPNTLDTTVDFDPAIPDTYVITGDIDAMWLRDSSAQIHPYLPLMRADAGLRRLVEGVILRQMIFVQRDPYANAHYKDTSRTSEWKAMDRTDMRPGVHERKWELDSLCYVLRLMYSYWKEVDGDMELFHKHQEQFQKTIQLILQTMKEQQRFNGSGPYSYQRQGHPADPHGHPAKVNGLIHSFFRPSDDLQKYPYLIPSQFFAHHTLKRLLKLVKHLKWTKEFEDEINTLISQLHEILFDERIKKNEETLITHKHPKYGLIYAFEIDGLGNRNLMDDSNIPSLLSLPYLCPDDIPIDDPVYQNTRKFILSPDNPWFFKGSVIEGTGGPHVGHGMAWPLAITVRGLTTTDEEEIRLCLNMLQNSHGDTGFMHESVNVNNPKHFTRAWFAWANSLFGEFFWKVVKERPHLVT